MIAQQIERVEGVSNDFDPATAWLDIPLAVIDFETTGFDETQDRIVEVGVVCFHKGEHTLTKNWLVNPDMAIPDQARKVHGISDEMVANEPPFAEIAKELQGLLKGHLPVAYNAAFDRKFLLAEMGKLGLRGKKPPALQSDVVWVDPLVWARELQKEEKSKKLGDVCKRMGIELNDAHRAWADAEATGKVLMRLADQMPRSYSELIRIQKQYAAQQEAAMAAWRNRRG